MRVDGNIVRRGMTILIVAPTVVGLLSHWAGQAALVWFLTFVAMVEWTAMKRHLKVVLLSSLVDNKKKIDGRKLAALAAGGKKGAASADEEFDLLRRGVMDRHLKVKAILKRVERHRKEQQHIVQVVKAVRDSVIGKLRMLPGLPDAYRAATALSRRRLVFNRAAMRIHAKLRVELDDITADLAAFMQQYGAIFPSNLIPGVQHAPQLPPPADPVADFVRSHLVDLDDDAA